MLAGAPATETLEVVPRPGISSTPPLPVSQDTALGNSPFQPMVGLVALCTSSAEGTAEFLPGALIYHPSGVTAGTRSSKKQQNP